MTRAVRQRLRRVRETCSRFRLNHTPDPNDQAEDAEAEWQLHAEVYFLAMSVNRVRLFHLLTANHIADEPRRSSALKAFEEAAPILQRLRDFLEHLDEYLVDGPRKHQKFPGRASPVLHWIWDEENVKVEFGPNRLDITLAAAAAIDLGEKTLAVWDEHLSNARSMPSTAAERAEPVSVMEVTSGISPVIGNQGEFQVFSGVLSERPPLALTKTPMRADRGGSRSAASACAHHRVPGVGSSCE